MTPRKITTLRARLEANGWRIAKLCASHPDYAAETPQSLKAALAETPQGQALLEELRAKMPRSGPSGGHRHTGRLVRGMPDEEYTEQVEHAKSRGLTWSAWVRGAAEQRLRREKK